MIRWLGRVGVPFVLTSLFPFSGSAQEAVEIRSFQAETGNVALGGVLRLDTSPYLAPEKDHEQPDRDLVPLFLYEGKYLFSRGSAGGIHIVDRDAFEFNLYARYRFQQLDPESNRFFEGLQERQTTVDAGLQISVEQNWGDLRIAWLTDALDRHDGEEVELSYRYGFEAGGWSLSPFASWSWRDEKLTDYYFGVSEAEARPDRPVFSAGSSQWFGIGLNAARQVSDRTMIFGNVGVYATGSDVVDSPLVDKSAYVSAFLGGTYRFGNVREPIYIGNPERHKEWTWKVNYGYQADGNIVGDLDQGNFSRSSFSDARIGGFTLGRLLRDGRRANLYGRFALFRHFEDHEGNGDFFSYSAYAMATGKGYSRWSNEEWFRWGLGFGASYAQRVPITEKRKQVGRDSNTAHFLSYLEMQLDFPLRRVSKAAWLQNCYAGLSIVHRSGMFGTSDILGDVAGGSDWMTAHLECVR